MRFKFTDNTNEPNLDLRLKFDMHWLKNKTNNKEFLLKILGESLPRVENTMKQNKIRRVNANQLEIVTYTDTTEFYFNISNKGNQLELDTNVAVMFDQMTNIKKIYEKLVSWISSIRLENE